MPSNYQQKGFAYYLSERVRLSKYRLIVSGTKLWITGICQERLPEKGGSELCEIERE